MKHHHHHGGGGHWPGGWGNWGGWGWGQDVLVPYAVDSGEIPWGWVAIGGLAGLALALIARPR